MVAAVVMEETWGVVSRLTTWAAAAETSAATLGEVMAATRGVGLEWVGEVEAMATASILDLDSSSTTTAVEAAMAWEAAAWATTTWEAVVAMVEVSGYRCSVSRTDSGCWREVGLHFLGAVGCCVECDSS